MVIKCNINDNIALLLPNRWALSCSAQGYLDSCLAGLPKAVDLKQLSYSTTASDRAGTRMIEWTNDDDCCQSLINVFLDVFPQLKIQGGAQEPLYIAPQANLPASIHFRHNYPRSLLHEVAHYCLAGDKRRQMNDFGYWYAACGRTRQQQACFELVEARPQGLEKLMCEIVNLVFSPSIDDFSGRPPSDNFIQLLENAYQEMLDNPPPTAKKAINGLLHAVIPA